MSWRREDFFVYYIKIESKMENFLICYVKNWKYSGYFSKKTKQACLFIREFRELVKNVVIFQNSSHETLHLIWYRLVLTITFYGPAMFCFMFHWGCLKPSHFLFWFFFWKFVAFCGNLFKSLFQIPSFLMKPNFWRKAYQTRFQWKRS